MSLRQRDDAANGGAPGITAAAPAASGNGARLLPNLAIELLRRTAAGLTIGGVEVYPSGALAPFEYRTRGDPCGVVLFWTREVEYGTGWSWIQVAAAAFLGLDSSLPDRPRVSEILTQSHRPGPSPIQPTVTARVARKAE
jgi:hypothetical protein